MRAKKFLKNGIVIIFCQLFVDLMVFVNRTVFIYTLPSEYLGIDGLFSNILALLSLSELGIGSVIILNMYEPFAKADQQRLTALLSFYRNAYRMIAAVIAAAGLLLTPFLPYLIKDQPDIPHLTLIYLLFLLNSAVSYLYIYKQSLFIADQRMYVSFLLQCGVKFLGIVLQIVFLFATHNFIVYLLLQLAVTFFTNFAISLWADRCYPQFRHLGRERLAKDEKKSIYQNIFAMCNHRIGATVMGSTDNLLISRMIGLIATGINNNYSLIIRAVNQFANQIFNALTASIGNLVATAKKEDVYHVFTLLHFCDFWFYTFCTSCLFVLSNPFIRLVWGEQFLFPAPVVMVLCLNFYLTGIRKIPITFKETMGFLRQDRYKPLIEALINLALSILLALRIGVLGIFIGSSVSMITTSLWVEPYVLFHFGFHSSQKGFWLTNLRYFAVTALTVWAVSFLASLYTGPQFLMFLYKIAVCLIAPNLILFVLYHRSENFLGMKEALLSLLRTKKPDKTALR